MASRQDIAIQAISILVPTSDAERLEINGLRRHLATLSTEDLSRVYADARVLVNVVYDVFEARLDDAEEMGR